MSMLFTPDTPEAVVALMEDNRRLRYLFQMWETAGAAADRRAVLMREIRDEIRLQARIARELFFPAIVDATGGNDLAVRRAMVDHGSLLGLLSLFDAHAPESPEAAQYMRVVDEHVRQRVADEEREIYPRLRSLCADVDQLGDELRQFRSQLIFQQEAVAVPGGAQPAVAGAGVPRAA